MLIALGLVTGMGMHPCGGDGTVALSTGSLKRGLMLWACGQVISPIKDSHHLGLPEQGFSQTLRRRMKNEKLLLNDACCEYPLSLLMRLLSKWLKPC